MQPPLSADLKLVQSEAPEGNATLKVRYKLLLYGVRETVLPGLERVPIRRRQGVLLRDSQELG